MVRGIEAKLGKDGDFALTHISAWREESGDHQHFRLIEQILLTQDVLATIDTFVFGPPLTFRFLWRARKQCAPQSMAKAPRAFRLIFARDELPVKGEMTWEAPTPLDYQEDLERIVTALRSAKTPKKLVIVLDEIERGTPAAAQATMVMARRSLDLPGVHVVLPFVRDVLSYNAFHPINIISTELLASAWGVMAADDELKLLSEEAAIGINPAEYPSAFSAASKVQSSDEKVQDKDKSTPTRTNASDAADEWVSRRRMAGHDAMLLGLMRQSANRQQTIMKKISEKYISSDTSIGCVRPEDLTAYLGRKLSFSGKVANGGLTANLCYSIASSLAESPKESGESAVTDERLQAAVDFLQNESDWHRWVAVLLERTLFDKASVKNLPLLAGGSFSWRRFGPVLERVIGVGPSVEEVQWPQPFSEGLNSTEGRLAWAVAQVLFTAVGLLHLEEGKLFNRG